MCWASSEVLQVVDGWQNAGVAKCQHQRPECSSPTGTVVRSHSDSGELSLSAWKTPGWGRQASEVSHVVSDPGRPTSKCRWRHVQQCPTHAVTCPLMSLVHQQEQRCSNQSMNSQRHKRVWPTSQSPTTAGDVGVDEVSSSSPCRCETWWSTQIRRNVDAEQTNMATGSDNICA